MVSWLLLSSYLIGLRRYDRRTNGCETKQPNLAVWYTCIMALRGTDCDWCAAEDARLKHQVHLKGDAQ